MRIKVEFEEPSTGDQREIILEGPDMHPEDLREIILDALEDSGMELPEEFDIKITEVAQGTIH